MKNLGLVIMLILTCALGGEKIVPLKPSSRSWKLAPEDRGAVVDVSNAKINGVLNEGDRRQIVALLGRIEGISRKVLQIDAHWDEYPVAVRILLAGSCVYCVKDADTVWQVSGVVMADPH